MSIVKEPRAIDFDLTSQSFKWEPFPLAVICVILGLPPEDRAMFPLIGRENRVDPFPLCDVSPRHLR